MLNKSEISKRVLSNKPFHIRFKYAEKEILMILNSISGKLLAKTDHIFLLNPLITIMREVIMNAQKANAKRVFFLKNNLNIKNPEVYKKGMERFSEEVIGDFESFKKEMVNSDHFIDILFDTNEKEFKITVSNDVAIVEEELDRINLRIKKAIQYNDFTDAYSDIEDSTEGAGLGIVLTILFLKSMGIDPKTFTIDTDGKITRTNIVIPNELRAQTLASKMKDEIINNIDGIPTFPENIIQLQSLCNDPNSSIDLIVKKIEVDPALATDVIKLSNSAGFITGKRIDSVSSAVMTIGLKNVNAILVASNARKILDERYSNFQEIWDHCNKTAFYARLIGQTLKKKSVSENAFMGGLLHDLGKIILLSTDMKLIQKIADQMKDRKIITSTILEEIAIGISHSTIGGLIAKKWNFPDYLVDAIKNHHAPLNSPEEYKDIVFSVYLANLFCGIESRKYIYYFCEDQVLERFKLDDEEKFNALHEKLKKKYKEINL